MKFESKYKTFHSRKSIWKCLWNGGHFVQGRSVITLSPEQTWPMLGRRYFDMHFLEEWYSLLIQKWLWFVSVGPIDNMSTLFLVIYWCRQTADQCLKKVILAHEFTKNVNTTKNQHRDILWSTVWGLLFCTLCETGDVTEQSSCDIKTMFVEYCIWLFLISFIRWNW